MRKELQELEGVRTTFISEFIKVSGKKNSGSDLVVLIRNIRSQDGKILADHLWIDYSREFETLQLHEGETIIFRGRVSKYHKGKKKQLEDYYVQYPTLVQRFGQHSLTPKRRKRVRKETKKQLIGGIYDEHNC